MRSRGSCGIRFASYNVHGWLGSDRRWAPDRVFSVVRELDADVLGLQEVILPVGGEQKASVDRLLRATGLQALHGPTLLRRDGHYGNLLLTRWPALQVRRWNLSVPGREPRGALDVDLDVRGFTVRIVSTHLGRRAAERERQMDQLLDVVAGSEGDPLVMMGDFNEWLPWNGRLRRIQARFGPGHPRATFPSRFPLLALDRIWVRPAGALKEIGVHRSPLSRVASDHLPLRACLRLEGGES